jgi:hypothetical protein
LKLEVRKRSIFDDLINTQYNICKVEIVEQKFEAIPQNVRNRVIRLVATSIKELQKEHFDPVLTDGIDSALKFFPNTFNSPADRDIANQFLNYLDTQDVDSFQKIEPYTLSKDEKEMFIRCGGGVNEETALKLKSFYYDSEIKSEPSST